MAIFPNSPTLTLHDPLGELLGVAGGLFSYTFDDVVKLSGHACPTVAGAFLMAKRGLELLYPQTTPERGAIQVTIHGPVNQGVNGPVSQVLTLITGAAADNGFQGLGGQFVRAGLLTFKNTMGMGFPRVTLRRRDTGQEVTLVYSPAPFAPAATMGDDLTATLSGHGDAATRQRFTQAWRERVERILADEGKQTVQHTP